MAFMLLEREALPFYRKNSGNRQKGLVVYPERTSVAAAIPLMIAGLDYHLARLKYFVDLTEWEPPLLHQPYFNWRIDASLVTKITEILNSRKERRLREQLMEVTGIRDTIIHPKLYVIEEVFSSASGLKARTAKLAPGSNHREKVKKRKLAREERTKSLKLPLVPTWLSYADGVLVILVIHRFLNLIKKRYGNLFWIGSVFLKSRTTGFFKNEEKNHSINSKFEAWVLAFFNSLSNMDRIHVEKVLKSPIKFYLEKTLDFPRPRTMSRFSLQKWEKKFHNPPRPKFYLKPPSWKRGASKN